MHAWKSIQKVLDHIEDNMAQPHSPEELSKIAELSPFYFQRLFTRLVKRPVNEYVKMRRLARACETLGDKKKRILDIALECGFNSHEGLTKTFKAAFGITPEEYRNNPVRLNQIAKPELQLGYTMIEEGVPLIADSIVLEISRKTLHAPERYIGLSGRVSVSLQTPVGETTGIDAPGMLWDKFHTQKAGLQGLAQDGIELALSAMDEIENDTFAYFVGASALPGATAYGDFVIRELPAGEYVVCTFEAEHFAELTTSALGKSLNYLFATWLPQHGLSSLPFSAEKYHATDPDTNKMEIWVMPVPDSKATIIRG